MIGTTTPAISIKIDSTAVLSQLREIGQDRQGPYILSRSLSLIAKEVQQALRGEEVQSLNLRHKSWVTNQVKIAKDAWSSKTKLKVTIALSDAATFISRLETGETKHPTHKWLLVPNAKVFGRRIIGKDDPLNLHKLNLHATPRGLQGDQRTFMVRSKIGTPLVLQRIGKDAKGKAKRGVDRATGVRVLYYGIRQAKIPIKLHWYEVADQTVQQRQHDIFAGVLAQALASGRR